MKATLQGGQSTKKECNATETQHGVMAVNRLTVKCIRSSLTK